MPKRGDEASQRCGWGPKSVTVSRTGEARPGGSPPTFLEQADPRHGRFCVAFSYPLWIQCISFVTEAVGYKYRTHAQ